MLMLPLSHKPPCFSASRFSAQSVTEAEPPDLAVRHSLRCFILVLGFLQSVDSTMMMLAAASRIDDQTSISPETTAVTRTTRITRTSQSSNIAQNIPDTRDGTLKRLRAYAQWNWGRFRNPGGQQTGKFTLEPSAEQKTNGTIVRPGTVSVINTGHAITATENPNANAASIGLPQESSTGIARADPLTEAPEGSTPLENGRQLGITIATSQAQQLKPEFVCQTLGADQRLGSSEYQLAIVDLPTPNIDFSEPSKALYDLPKSSADLVEAAQVASSQLQMHPEGGFEHISGPSVKTGERTRRLIPPFRPFGDDIYLATGMVPNAPYITMFETKWDEIFRDKMRLLSVDDSDMFVFEMRMLGSSPRIESMKPTLLIICNKTVQQTLRAGLAALRKEIVPSEVQLVVIGKNVGLASPARLDQDSFRPMVGLSVDLCARRTGAVSTLMGCVSRIRPGHYTYRSSTIGGIISVGDTLYALTTAHSLFTEAPESMGSATTVQFSDSEIPASMVTEFYHWVNKTSWNDNTSSSSTSTAKRINSPMDWALLSLSDHSILPNSFPTQIQASDMAYVSGYVQVNDFAIVEDVFVFGGVTGMQNGTLSSTRATFMFSGSAFGVYSIALERPLEEGDSGSWVVSQDTHELCGYIFARIDGLEWAYMLPIEPVFDQISKILSKAGGEPETVNVPSPSTIEILKAKRNTVDVSNSRVTNTTVPDHQATLPETPNHRSNRSEAIQNHQHLPIVTTIPPAAAPDQRSTSHTLRETLATTDAASVVDGNLDPDTYPPDRNRYQLREQTQPSQIPSPLPITIFDTPPRISRYTPDPIAFNVDLRARPSRFQKQFPRAYWRLKNLTQHYSKLLLILARIIMLSAIASYGWLLSFGIRMDLSRAGTLGAVVGGFAVFIVITVLWRRAERYLWRQIFLEEQSRRYNRVLANRNAIDINIEEDRWVSRGPLRYFRRVKLKVPDITAYMRRKPILRYLLVTIKRLWDLARGFGEADKLWAEEHRYP